MKENLSNTFPASNCMVGEVEVPAKIHLAGQGRKYLSKDKQLWGPIAKCINRAPEWDASRVFFNKNKKKTPGVRSGISQKVTTSARSARAKNFPS